MSRSKEFAEPKIPGRFSTSAEFMLYCRNHLHGHERFWFVSPGGEKGAVRLEDAVLSCERIHAFLSAPEKIGSMTLDDGRRIVAKFNFVSLTQHLRWACGFDADSNHHGKAPARVVWPLAAQVWFWFNEGAAPRDIGAHDGETYAMWSKRLEERGSVKEIVSRVVDLFAPIEEEYQP